MSARRLLDTMSCFQGDVGILGGGSEWMETFEYLSLFLSLLTFLPLFHCLLCSCWFHLIATFSLLLHFHHFPVFPRTILPELLAAQTFSLINWELSVIFKIITLAWHKEPLCHWHCFVSVEQPNGTMRLPRITKRQLHSKEQTKARLF